MTKNKALKLAREGVEIHSPSSPEYIVCAALIEALAQRKPLTGEFTTFVQRFTDAVAILCGSEPPANFVDEWLCNVEVNGVHRLQEWVLNQDATPTWSQGIVVLDAAYLLAESPAEGLQHESAHVIKGDT